nr:N-acetyltransferase [Oscillospiraceae bacterium]
MIRIAIDADVPAMLAIYAPYVQNTTVSFEYAVPTAEEFLRRFQTVTAQFPWLVWEEDSRILGYAYAAAPFERAAFRWCAEPSIYLLPEAQGRGIAAKLYTALETLLQLQGYQVMYALITEENLPSVRFHEKCGYHTCTVFPDCGFKFGRWLGLRWMEKRLEFVRSPSAPPLSWLSIVQDAERFTNILDSLSLS